MNPDRRSYRANTYGSFALEGPRALVILSFFFFFKKSCRCILMSNYSVTLTKREAARRFGKEASPFERGGGGRTESQKDRVAEQKLL